MDDAFVFLPGWLSSHDWLILQSVSQTFSRILADELDREIWESVEDNNLVLGGDEWQEFMYGTNEDGRSRPTTFLNPQPVLAVLVDASTCSQVANRWHVQRAASVIGSQLASVPHSRLVPHGVVLHAASP